LARGPLDDPWSLDMMHVQFLTTRRSLSAGVAAILTAATLTTANAEGDAQRGAALYRACAACHSLVPGLHLTGPSLADLWEKKAASIADYPRYSEALGIQAFLWDRTTLDAWLADPEAFVPGNNMSFRGVPDARARSDLIAFLGIAMAPGGAKSVVERGLIPDRLARGQAPEPLDKAGLDQQVASIRHCKNSYFVVMADGTEHSIWEFNLRIKVDSGATGPKGTTPVLVGSGMQGDRVSVVFANPAQIGRFIQSNC
jgi:cytochrome c